MKTNESLPLTAIAKRCGLSRDHLTAYCLAKGFLKFDCWSASADASAPDNKHRRAYYTGDYVVNLTTTKVDVTTGVSHCQQYYLPELIDLVKASLSAEPLGDLVPSALLPLEMVCSIMTIDYNGLVEFLSSAASTGVFKRGLPTADYQHLITADLLVTKAGVQWMKRNQSWLTKGADKFHQQGIWKREREAAAKKAAAELPELTLCESTSNPKRPQRLVTKSRRDALLALSLPCSTVMLSGAMGIGFGRVMDVLEDALSWLTTDAAGKMTANADKVAAGVITDDCKVTPSGMAELLTNDDWSLDKVAYRH